MRSHVYYTRRFNTGFQNTPSNANGDKSTKLFKEVKAITFSYHYLAGKFLSYSLKRQALATETDETTACSIMANHMFPWKQRSSLCNTMASASNWGNYQTSVLNKSKKARVRGKKGWLERRMEHYWYTLQLNNLVRFSLCFLSLWYKLHLKAVIKHKG